MKNFIELLSNTLQDHADTLDAALLDEIRTMSGDLERNLVAARDENRNLRIAVIGQMKAGKSSFLNAAFFGRDLLPKADTPMTAALTKIVYAPQAKAEVEFYSADDWAGIERRAHDYDRQYAEEERRLMDAQAPQRSMSPFAKPQTPRKPSAEEVIRRLPMATTASRELVNKARQQGLNPSDYLGKKHTLDSVASAADLAQAMHDYVGSHGRFTAITKMSVLYVDDPRLEGLEIIDTPGFNDPVVSRGQITRGFLGQTDVVFLLSNMGQFLTASDMSVLREQLPEAGIDDKAVFLIGSQRDLALRQDRDIAHSASKQPDDRRAAAMIHLLDNKLGKLAGQTLDTQINQPGMDDKTRRILGAVKKNKPRFISSWAWMIAEKFDHLSEDDRYHLDELERATGYKFSPDTLRHLSNIPALRDEILAQRQRKIELITSKENILINGAFDGIKNRLNRMMEELIKRSERIRSNNISELEKAEHDIISRMHGGRRKIEDVFDQQFVKTSQNFALLKTEARKEAQKYQKVNVVREKTTESYQVDTSWFGGLFGHDWETRYRDVVTVYASAQDAIEKLEQFAIRAGASLQKSIIDCVDLDRLRREVSQASMSLFDTSDANFDAELMLSEVNKSLRRLTIPNIDFGKNDYCTEIVRAFGSDRVSEDQIDALKKAQREAMKIILTDLEGEMERKITTIGKSLESTGKTLVENMLSDIQKSLTELRNQIADKEQSLLRIDRAQACLVDQLVKLDTSAAAPA
ncbi:dynamin family protein [Leptothrix ochracea]|uniref:dynamin family protein n=1 Tax=Leptothrix ochracea TaxID=735331 RepID=UPI0034E2D549